MDERREPGAGLAEKAGREGDALNGTPRLDSDRDQDMGWLTSLPGLETVSEQLAGPIAVLRAEQGRRQAGAAVTRPAWKNVVFTGGPGSGKSRAAKAVARIYAELGLLMFGLLREIAAATWSGRPCRRPGRWWPRRPGAPAATC